MTLLEKSLVTVLGSGYSPIAPATVASAVTCVIFWFLPEALHWPWALLIIPASAIGIWMSDRAIAAFDVLSDERFRKLRRPNPHKGDPDQVVFDEFVGQWIALLTVPHSIIGFTAAFIAFRFFDIVKPLGISSIQKAKGGWGVMLDDLLAGLWAAVLLFFLFRYLPLPL